MNGKQAKLIRKVAEKAATKPTSYIKGIKYEETQAYSVARIRQLDPGCAKAIARKMRKAK